MLFRSMGLPLKVAPDQVQAIATADYPLVAVRPAYILLDCGLLAGLLSLNWPDWQDGVASVVTQLTTLRVSSAH